MEPVYAGATAAALSMFKLQGVRVEMRGLEHIPTSGGAVLAGNHVSYFDFLYVGWAAQRRGRRARYLTKVELYSSPVTRRLLNAMHHIPVDRSRGADAFAAALAALRKGEVIALFPEGSISRSLELTPFKSGAPLIPVIVWGSHRQWGKKTPKHLLRNRIPVVIEVGAPLAVGTGEDPAAITSRLQSVMTGMLHRIQEEYPAMTGEDRVFLPARLGGTAPTLEEGIAQEAAARAERARKKAEAARKKAARD